jgi:poly(A) polymerase Pap1
MSVELFLKQDIFLRSTFFLQCRIAESEKSQKLGKFTCFMLSFLLVIQKHFDLLQKIAVWLPLKKRVDDGRIDEAIDEH